MAVSVILFSTVGYFVQQHLVAWLLKPSKGQQFIYTTPTGGLNFLFQVCLYFGFTLSIPVFIYQALRYIEPLIHHHTRRTVLGFGFTSWLLAIGGAAFGYYVGLPIALGFLAHQFTTAQIKPLLTIQEYMSFVTIYLMGSALLFQIPLILLFINRIKPLSPKKLLSFERYFIAIAFIAAAIMTPTTDIFNQLLFAGPIIAVYQISIALIYLRNRRPRRQRSYDYHPAADLPTMPPNPFLQSPLTPATAGAGFATPPQMAPAAPAPTRGDITYTRRSVSNTPHRRINRPGVWDIV